MRDEDVAGFAAHLGRPGIFDVHVHFMAPEIQSKVWAYFDSAGPLLGKSWPIHYRYSDQERVEILRALSVKHFSTLSYAHKPGIARFMNDWTVNFAKAVPEALVSATFYPEPDAGEYVAELIDSGVEVFKAHMQVGQFPADHHHLDPVWAELERTQTPVVLHAGSGPAPGEFTGPASVQRVLERFPELPLIIAHLGMPEVKEFLSIAQQFDHVRLDTTMVFVEFWDDDAEVLSIGNPFAQLDTLADLGDRILFGSDFPQIPYPYAHQIAALRDLGLGDDWLRNVLWHNGAQLFHKEMGAS